jgi:kumamolisin
VDFPASSPYALACGGTHLEASGNVIRYEAVWNRPDDDGGGATGGGVSEIFPVPSWQSFLGVPPSVNSGLRGRGVPDVAANADPYSGYRIRLYGELETLGGNRRRGFPTGAVNPALFIAADDHCWTGSANVNAPGEK